MSTGCTKVSIFKRNLISSGASKQNDESAGDLPSPLRDLDTSSFKNGWPSEVSRKAIFCRTTHVTKPFCSTLSPQSSLKRAMTLIYTKEMDDKAWQLEKKPSSETNLTGLAVPAE